jgi:lambda repressor-like predicted transcriptional regulator
MRYLDADDDDHLRLCALLPAEPARQAVTAYAADCRLRVDEVADVLNLDARVLRSLLERRWVGWETADEIAVALGCHPYELWPEWFSPPPRPPTNDGEVARSAGEGRSDADTT